MNRERRNWLAHLALLGVAVFYSGNFIIAQDVMHGEIISPIVLVFFRVFGAGLLFWILHEISIREKIKRKHFAYLALCSVIGIVLAHNTYLFGLDKTTTINASLIISTTPIMIMIFSSIILQTKLNWSNLIGLGISATGVVLLITNSSPTSIQFLKEHRIGNLLILANAFTYGLYMVLVKRMLKIYHPLTVIKWIFTISAPIILFLAFPQLQTLEWNEIKETWIIKPYLVQPETNEPVDMPTVSLLDRM